MRINYSDEKIVDSDKSIFLAGPTPRGENAKSWRVDACKKLEELGFDGALMSGSGSTVFGLTRDEEILENGYNFFRGKYYFVRKTEILNEL